MRCITLLISVLLLNTQLAKSQINEWAPLGAKWTYLVFDRYPISGSDTVDALEYLTMESIKDTTIKGFNAKRLSFTRFTYDGDTLKYNPMYIREQNDKVFFLSKDSFWLLYDFMLNSTTGWYTTIHFPDPTNWEFKCSYIHTGYPYPSQSVAWDYDTISIGGYNIREQRISNIMSIEDSGCLYYEGQVLEYLGATAFFFGHIGYPGSFDDPFIKYLRTFAPIIIGLNCYSDHRFNYSNPMPPFNQISCNYIGKYDAVLSDLRETKVKKSIKPLAYPNPTSGKLNIDLRLSYLEIRIRVYSLYGKQINDQIHREVNSIELEIPGDPGVYFIELSLPSGYCDYLRVIKL